MDEAQSDFFDVVVRSGDDDWQIVGTNVSSREARTIMVREASESVTYGAQVVGWNRRDLTLEHINGTRTTYRLRKAV